MEGIVKYHRAMQDFPMIYQKVPKQELQAAPLCMGERQLIAEEGSDINSLDSFNHSAYSHNNRHLFPAIRVGKNCINPQ